MHYCNLSPIEQQVFNLLADDYTIQEIAHALDLWPYEVQTVIKSLTQKLGAK